MLSFLCACGVMALFIAAAVFAVLENRYQIDLLENSDLAKLEKLGATRLELARYRRNQYVGSRPRAFRTKTSLDAPQVASTNMFNLIEDELVVKAYKGKLAHEVFCCPFAAENLEKLRAAVAGFNAAHAEGAVQPPQAELPPEAPERSCAQSAARLGAN